MCNIVLVEHCDCVSFYYFLEIVYARIITIPSYKTALSLSSLSFVSLLLLAKKLPVTALLCRRESYIHFWILFVSKCNLGSSSVEILRFFISFHLFCMFFWRVVWTSVEKKAEKKIYIPVNVDPVMCLFYAFTAGESCLSLSLPFCF